jgi:Protein of unknown function (DUF2924)
MFERPKYSLTEGRRTLPLAPVLLFPRSITRHYANPNLSCAQGLSHLALVCLNHRPKLHQIARITVTEDGFEYAGTSYRSLTKIANKITGGHWSGPRFFGLPAAGMGRSVNGGRNG